MVAEAEIVRVAPVSIVMSVPTEVAVSILAAELSSIWKSPPVAFVVTVPLSINS